MYQRGASIAEVSTTLVTGSSFQPAARSLALDQPSLTKGDRVGVAGYDAAKRGGPSGIAAVAEHPHKSAAAPPCGIRRAGPPSEAGQPRVFGLPMKWVSLVSLTAQTSAQVFVIKWARQGGEGPRTGEGAAYLASTIVLFTELVKMCVSFFLVAWETGGLLSAASAVRMQLSRSYAETLKVCVPSLLYTVQNNLMFFSLLKLSAAVQQVTYQLKILTTALLSVVILGKSLNSSKWSALFLLLIGVVLVQWPSQSSSAEGLSLASHFDAMLGFGTVLVACFTSGFASVYLEKLLKQTDISIWMRNVQLGAFGSLMALVVAVTQDGAHILERGFTQGYSWRVLCVILTNALGGLLCAAVLKYADNILRCFSTALSIILTCILSACVLQEYVPDLRFVVGATLAISATFLYSLGPPQLNIKEASRGS